MADSYRPHSLSPIDEDKVADTPSKDGRNTNGGDSRNTPIFLRNDDGDKYTRRYVDKSGNILIECEDAYGVLGQLGGFDAYVQAHKEGECQLCGDTSPDWPLEYYRTMWPQRPLTHWVPKREAPVKIPDDGSTATEDIVPPPAVPDPEDSIAVDLIHEQAALPINRRRKVAVVRNYLLHLGQNLYDYVHKVPDVWEKNPEIASTFDTLRLFFFATTTVNNELFTPRLTTVHYEDLTQHNRLPIYWLAHTLEEDKFGNITKYVSEPEADGSTFTSYVVTFKARNNPSESPHLPLRCASSSDPARNVQFALLDGSPRIAQAEISRRAHDLCYHLSHPLLTLMICLELYTVDDMYDKRNVEQTLRRIEVFTETGIPTYPKMQKRYLVPETLEYYDLPWEIDKVDKRYIVITRELTVPETDVIFEHSQRMITNEHPELKRKVPEWSEKDSDQDNDNASQVSYDSAASRESRERKTKLETHMLAAWAKWEAGVKVSRSGRRSRSRPGFLRRSSTADNQRMKWIPAWKNRNTAAKAGSDENDDNEKLDKTAPVDKANGVRTNTLDSDLSIESVRRSERPARPSRVRFSEEEIVRFSNETIRDPKPILQPTSAKDADTAKYKEQASRISTLAINMARLQSSLDFNLKLARFLIAENRPLLEKTWKWNSANLIQSRVENAQRSLEVLNENMRGLEKRATTQQSLLYSLISQADSSIGIRIAQSSEGIAADSKRDSSAMKTLAVLTMLFLPATAVASIFSMDFFVWPSHGDSMVKVQFYIYWIVTLPLTALCIMVWDQWTKWRREDDEIMRIRRQQSNEEDAEDAIETWLLENSAKRAFIRRLTERWFPDRRNTVSYRRGSRPSFLTARDPRSTRLYGEVDASDRESKETRRRAAFQDLSKWLRRRSRHQRQMSDVEEPDSPRSFSPSRGYRSGRPASFEERDNEFPLRTRPWPRTRDGPHVIVEE